MPHHNLVYGTELFEAKKYEKWYYHVYSVTMCLSMDSITYRTWACRGAWPPDPPLYPPLICRQIRSELGFTFTDLSIFDSFFYKSANLGSRPKDRLKLL